MKNSYGYSNNNFYIHLKRHLFLSYIIFQIFIKQYGWKKLKVYLHNSKTGKLKSKKMFLMLKTA